MGKRHDMWARLEEIYRRYPRKQGKSRGMQTASVQCKTKEAQDQLELAINNYIAHIIETKKEPDYIMYFSTFMREWKDWLEPGHGSIMSFKKELDLSKAGFE